MAEKFPNLGRNLDIQVHEALSSPLKFQPKRSFPRHIMIKLSKIKDKERISKAAREKKSSIHRDSHKAISGFLSRDLSARREWDDIFKVLKETANQEYYIQQSCPSEMKVR